MSDITHIFGSDLIAPREEPNAIATLADAEQALKVIAVAEAAETLWAQAKNPEELYKAVKAKLAHQARYAAWRPTVSPQGGDGSNQHKRAKPSEREGLLPAADPGEQIVRRWRTRLIPQTKMDMALDDARHRCLRICEQENLGTIRGTEGTGEFERYTPALYIEKARQVLGTIDLDPASCEYAQRTVRAEHYFTIDDDGLARDWFGRVWLNPPYHRELAPKFIDKLLVERRERRIAQAIVLVNNSTDTAWFRAAADECNSMCFTTGRIRFEVPNREPVLPTQGQAFLYFGLEAEIFADVFHAIGFCARPV